MHHRPSLSLGPYFLTERLLRAGADPNARGPGGQTPVHLAFSLATVSTAVPLLEHGGDMELPDDKSGTPMKLFLVSARCGLFEKRRRKVEFDKAAAVGAPLRELAKANAKNRALAMHLRDWDERTMLSLLPRDVLLYCILPFVAGSSV